jgi:hypothetical protein
MANVLDISNLKRDPDYIKKYLLISKDQVYTKKDMTIHIPQRYAQKSLAILGEENYCVGIFPIIMDNKYSVMSLMSLLHLSSAVIDEVVINDTDYYTFFFEAGSEFIQETEVVRDDSITFNVFDEFISQGNIPWFIEYLDLANIYDTAGIYADSKMPRYKYPYEILISLMTRSPNDRMKLYRYTLNKYSDLDRYPDFTQLKSVMYMSKSTLNKIAGAYMDEGVVSALVYPSDRVERIEKLLRT